MSTEKMAYNVPAVGDGFVAQIRACEARPGLQNCGFRKTPQRAFQRLSARPNGVLRNPEAAEWRRNANRPVMRSASVY